MSGNRAETPAAGRLEWSVLPFKESARRSAVVALVILACGALVYAGFGDVFMAVVSILVLTGSLHTYFSRTTYCLDEHGLTIRTPIGKTAKKWSDFKRFIADRKGVTLSPFAKPSRLEPFRSVRLLYGGNKDEVVAFISKRFDRTSGDGTA